VETNMYVQFMEVVCYTNLMAILISLIFITNYKNLVLLFGHIKISICTKLHQFVKFGPQNEI